MGVPDSTQVFSIHGKLVPRTVQSDSYSTNTGKLAEGLPRLTSGPERYPRVSPIYNHWTSGA